MSPGKPNHWVQEGHYLIPKNLIFIKIQYFTHLVDIDGKKAESCVKLNIQSMNDLLMAKHCSVITISKQ